MKYSIISLFIKVVRRKSILLLILGTLVGGIVSQRAHAQWGTAAKIVAPYVFDQVRSLSARKAKWILKGMKHTWWFCRYQNGVVTYNNFRSYRTGEEVYHYFTVEGDCDSFRYDEYSRKLTVCYSPSLIQQYASLWGPIVEIGIAQ